jgi:DNA modification methylase
MSESFLDGKVTLRRGDCLEVLPLLEANSIDSCVTDPPYHLTSIVKRFGSNTAAPCQHGTDGAYARASKGFMGKQWDGGDIAFRPELWAEVLRVLKPGAHLLAFSSTRTYHRMACAIEDAGFEIRDQIGWCYGSGFPKSHDVSKGIDRLAGAERAKVPARGGLHKNRLLNDDGWSNIGLQEPLTDSDEPATESAIQWQGWGTALKPAWECICLARKPLSESSIAANVLKHGTGGINVDGCRVGLSESDDPRLGGKGDWSSDKMAKNVYEGGYRGERVGSSPLGRWPANLIHDGSEEVLAGFPDLAPSKPGSGGTVHSGRHGGFADIGPNPSHVPPIRGHADNGGSAARFFYTAKADADDRLGSKHPTVKPLDLMGYLIRLITPKGGYVLDPFAGTGTTAEAAWREGCQAILIEREEEYQADIVKRMGLCLSGPEERRAASVKQLPPDDLPMFGGGI